MPWHTQILANQLTLFQTGETDYARLITSGTHGFSDLPMALSVVHRGRGLDSSTGCLPLVEIGLNDLPKTVSVL